METRNLAARLREVKPPLGENLIVLATATSTNDVARGILEALPREVLLCDLVVVATEQTKGRGREQRSWWSPRGGGLYATLVWGFDDASALARVPLAVAVALCDVVRRTGVDRCRLKWPNDVVVDGRKLAGILVETSGPATGSQCTIIGLGVNLEADRASLEEVDATCLAQECPDPPDLAQLAIDSICSVRRELATCLEDSTLVERYRELVVHKPGDRMVWRQGRKIVEGYYRRIDESGFLELETDSGLLVVNAGEIFTG